MRLPSLLCALLFALPASAQWKSKDLRISPAWNGGHLKLGEYSVWVDAAGNLRFRYGTPTGDADGSIISESRRASLAFGASMQPDLSLGTTFEISVTSNSAFTVLAPASSRAGQRMTLVFKNEIGGGGSLGSALFAGYVTQGFDSGDTTGILKPPADTKQRSIEFEYTGSTWAERSRTPADVPIAEEVETLLAFPGCRGAGCYSRGGFDTNAGTPTVYRVTSLSNGSGAGTLGQCIAASGPRVCVFAVAGEIVATTGYTISNPYITIRADTAPGQGIEITKNGVADGVPFYIRTHDVVIRGLRVRGGNTTGPTSNRTALAILPTGSSASGATNNIVLDHSTVNWGQGENISIYSLHTAAAANQPRDITFSYNILAEGLMAENALPNGYSKSGLIAGDTTNLASGTHLASYADSITDIDIHHNFWGNARRRNPELRVSTARFVNNVLYNTGTEGLNPYGAMDLDFIGNTGKAGPNNSTYPGYSFALLTGLGYWYNENGKDAIIGDQSVYLSGNAFSGGSEQGWGTAILTTTDATVCGNPPEAYVRCRPPTWPVHRAVPLSPAASGPSIVATTAAVAESAVTGAGGAGHSRRLDCGGAWVTTGIRDTLEQRLIDSYATPPAYFAFNGCTGNACWPITAADAAGTSTNNGFPVITAVSTTCAAGARDNTSCACADSDSDGIPDFYETSKCGGATACDAMVASIDPPWTNIEAFMSGENAVP